MSHPNLPPELSGPSLGGFSVKNPVLLNILFFTILILGIFSITRLPQEQFAEVPFFRVNILVPYPGASAVDLETSVTVPIENQYRSMSKIKRISSTTSEGLSAVFLEFEDNVTKEEFERLYQEVQTRFTQIVLPEGTLEPLIDDFSSTDFTPVVELIVSGNVSYKELRKTALDLRDEILKVNGVKDAEPLGLRERQILITALEGALESRSMASQEILQAIQRQNVSLPGGTLTTGSREYLVRTLGEVSQVENFGEIIVRRGQDGVGVVKVKDVAQVSDSYNPDAAFARFNGESAITLRVTKVVGRSSLTIVDGVKKLAQSWTDKTPLGITLTPFNDSTVQVKDSLDVLTSNAAMGFILVIFMLWAFLGIRNALMVAVGIPVTFAMTFMVLEFLGQTINTNTLFGLVLVLGLIVDHGIVIVENSYRLKQEGLHRAAAAVKGVNQVAWPVIAATATTVAAFLPLMLIPGIIGRFLLVIPLTVSIALVVSTFESLIFLPSHFADWGKEKIKKNPKEPGSWFDPVVNWYFGFSRAFYKRRGWVFLGFLAVTVGSFFLVTTLKQDLFAAEDFTFFTIDIKMPPGTPLSVTDQVTRKYEELILPLKGKGEVVAVRSSIGGTTSAFGGAASSDQASILVDLTELQEGRTRPIPQIMEEIEARTRGIAGTENVFFRRAINGPPTGAPLGFRLQGNNLERLEDVSSKIQSWLSKWPVLYNIEDDYQEGSPELRVLINPERASALGLDPVTVGNWIRIRNNGLKFGTFFIENEEIPLVLRFDSMADQTYESLVQSRIPTLDGRLIPFSSIGRVEQGRALASIRRVDGKREIAIKSEATDRSGLPKINEQIISLYNKEIRPLYPDIEFKVGGDFSEFADLLVQIARIFLVGLFLIYLILGAQFKSYSQPFIILLSVPFAFVGVILYLAISGTPFSTTVLYAGVALAGIAVNDAIVLIDFINSNRKEGVPLADTILEGTRTRLRPILLTSVTTIAGLLPTALGIGGSSVVWQPMASTIIFGLLLSTLSALVVIPSLYGLLYDKKPKKLKIRKEVTQ